LRLENDTRAGIEFEDGGSSDAKNAPVLLSHQIGDTLCILDGCDSVNFLIGNPIPNKQLSAILGRIDPQACQGAGAPDQEVIRNGQRDHALVRDHIDCAVLPLTGSSLARALWGNRNRLDPHIDCAVWCGGHGERRQESLLLGMEINVGFDDPGEVLKG